MIQSMTGFGKAQIELSNSCVEIELKSLNSKHLDINIKMPPPYKEKEFELKKFLTSKLSRGKVEIFIQSDLSNPNTDSVSYTHLTLPTKA